MRVLCCYANLHPETARRLAQHAPGCETEDVSGDREAYWRQIEKRWGGDDDLVIIEHDIGIHEQVLPQFGACPEPWCTFPYPYPGFPGLLESGIGCVRFRAQAMARVAPADIAGVYGSCQDCAGELPGCWLHLDGKIAQALFDKAGLRRPHVHMPAVSHYREGVNRV